MNPAIGDNAGKVVWGQNKWRDRDTLKTEIKSKISAFFSKPPFTNKAGGRAGGLFLINKQSRENFIPPTAASRLGHLALAVLKLGVVSVALWKCPPLLLIVPLAYIGGRALSSIGEVMQVAAKRDAGNSKMRLGGQVRSGIGKVFQIAGVAAQSPGKLMAGLISSACNDIDLAFSSSSKYKQPVEERI